MIELIRPDGGRSWVDETRAAEYIERGFARPSPAPDASQPPADAQAEAIEKPEKPEKPKKTQKE